MSRRRRCHRGAFALGVLAALWAAGPGSARAGEILWHHDTGG